MGTLLENLETFCKIPGTSGDEAAVREAIYQEIKDLPGCTVRTDNAGNLIAEKAGKEPPKSKVLFCAHMDEVGFIVTRIDEQGFLHFGCVGGIDSRVVIGKRVLVGKDRIPGLIGAKALHLLTKEQRGEPAEIKDLFIDIGADGKEATEALVRPGDRAVWDTDFCLIGGGNAVCSRAIDDRAGCALLVELLKGDAPYGFTAAFTTREEVDGNGAPAAGFSAEPDISVVVEATSAGDGVNAAEADYVCAQGKGPVISFIDKGTVYDPALYEAVTALAQENGIPFQPKEGIAGANDSRPIHKSRAGVRPAAVSLPARYIHSPVTTLRIEDFENTLRLLAILRGELPKL